MASELLDENKRPESPKPREEIPYAEIYPDLNVNEPLTLIRSGNLNSRQQLVALLGGRNELVNGKIGDKHYIRYHELSEEEQLQKIEYDLDDDDFVWLSLYNQKERKKSNLPSISPEMLELVLDRLEKEWFQLTKHIQKALSREEEASYPDDLPCNICSEAETSHMNLIVFCDGCDLAVHQECYGVPHIPEGPWLCRRCLLAPDSILKCIFCPNVGGAMKQTLDNRWAHSVCGNWIPEANVANQVYQEPIDSIDRIPKARWQLLCSICNKKRGACIQCSSRTCRTAYHVSCAINHNYFMDEGNWISYCPKHDPGTDTTLYNQTTKVSLSVPTQKRNFVPLAIPRNSASSKVQRINPIAPMYIVNKLLFEHLAKVSMKKKMEFVYAACKYWALKREEKRGIPLLKRLRLEPWTPHTKLKSINIADATEKAQALRMIRKDLEKVRILAELVRQREKNRLKRLKLQIGLFEIWTSPLSVQMRLILEAIKCIDHKGLFLHPVNAQEIPDYCKIVKNPISFLEIESNIDHFQYDTLKDFTSDFILLCDNAVLYNRADTIYAKTAKVLKENGLKIIKEKEAYLNKIKVKSCKDILDCGLTSKDFVYFDDDWVESTKKKPQKNTETSDETNNRDDKSAEKKQAKSDKKSLRPKRKAQAKKTNLVWAKVGGFPWFPGKIIKSNSSIPPNILALKHAANDLLIKFYDDTWAWLPEIRIQQFNGTKDFELNQKIVMSKSVKRKFEVAFENAMKDHKIE